MNNQKVREIIKSYKRHFNSIHNEEIYKWHAVKCFQDNWNISAENFPEMVHNSFASAKNLLDSGLYYPKRMLHHYTAREPETVRQLFRNLYNENDDFIERTEAFQVGIKSINKKYFPDKNDYQDKRAVLVYLCLHYPERYFLYKFAMFKAFARLVDYPYQPKPGKIQNILEYLTLCEIVKGEITKDADLLELHKTRLSERVHHDSSYNILTQDVIYAAVRHIDKFERGGRQDSALNRLIKMDKTVTPKSDTVILKGSFINHIENEREQSRIGTLGELLVLQHEQEKLKSLGIDKLAEHKSKSEGDGLGYDIRSFDEKGNEIFIEVKTTLHGSDTPFYITRKELERSKQDSDKFWLYRLYDFDEMNNKAKYFERKGNLIQLCDNPILYKVSVE